MLGIASIVRCVGSRRAHAVTTIDAFIQRERAKSLTKRSEFTVPASPGESKVVYRSKSLPREVEVRIPSVMSSVLPDYSRADLHTHEGVYVLTCTMEDLVVRGWYERIEVPIWTVKMDVDEDFDHQLGYAHLPVVNPRTRISFSIQRNGEDVIVVEEAKCITFNGPYIEQFVKWLEEQESNT